jgi:competence protein ComGC
MSKSPSRPTAPFAVIELIAILVIVGILVSILAPTFTKRTDPAGPATNIGEPATPAPAKP